MPLTLFPFHPQTHLMLDGRAVPAPQVAPEPPRTDESSNPTDPSLPVLPAINTSAEGTCRLALARLLSRRTPATVLLVTLLSLRAPVDASVDVDGGGRPPSLLLPAPFPPAVVDGGGWAAPPPSPVSRLDDGGGCCCPPCEEPRRGGGRKPPPPPGGLADMPAAVLMCGVDG